MTIEAIRARNFTDMALKEKGGFIYEKTPRRAKSEPVSETIETYTFTADSRSLRGLRIRTARTPFCRKVSSMLEQLSCVSNADSGGKVVASIRKQQFHLHFYFSALNLATTPDLKVDVSAITPGFALARAMRDHGIAEAGSVFIKGDYTEMWLYNVWYADGNVYHEQQIGPVYSR